jgi:hypothetical protein
LTTHELARLLLAAPDVRVVVDGQDGGYDTPRVCGAILRPDAPGQGHDDHYRVHVRNEPLQPGDVACVLLVGDDFPWATGCRSFDDAAALLVEHAYQHAAEAAP